MKIKTCIWSLIVCLSVLFSSCDEFLERDLNGQSVSIITPANNTVSSSYTVNFWWNDMKGASSYKLQIVKPDFAAVQQLIVDTSITSNQFSYTLQPGSYQWRLRAENSASYSDYVIYNLTIDSTLNLANQTLLLNLPVDNSYSNQLTQSFTWYAMPNASTYVFGIFNQSGVQIGNYQNVTAPTTTISYTFPSEGIFKWRVFAQNGSSVSPYTERIITVDTTKPTVPVLTYAPFNDTTTAQPVPLSWNNVEANAQYLVLISSDSTFATYIDTTTTSLNYNFYNSTLGQYYYWKVRTTDQAGNQGNFSIKKRFKRQ